MNLLGTIQAIGSVADLFKRVFDASIKGITSLARFFAIRKLENKENEIKKAGSNPANWMHIFKRK